MPLSNHQDAYVMIITAMAMSGDTSFNTLLNTYHTLDSNPTTAATTTTTATTATAANAVLMLRSPLPPPQPLPLPLLLPSTTTTTTTTTTICLNDDTQVVLSVSAGRGKQQYERDLLGTTLQVCSLLWQWWWRVVL